MPFDNQYEAKKDIREILIVDAHPILRQGLTRIWPLLVFLLTVSVALN